MGTVQTTAELQIIKWPEQKQAMPQHEEPGVLSLDNTLGSYQMAQFFSVYLLIFIVQQQQQQQQQQDWQNEPGDNGAIVRKLQLASHKIGLMLTVSPKTTVRSPTYAICMGGFRSFWDAKCRFPTISIVLKWGMLVHFVYPEVGEGIEIQNMIHVCWAGQSKKGIYYYRRGLRPRKWQEIWTFSKQQRDKNAWRWEKIWTSFTFPCQCSGFFKHFFDIF